MIARSFTALVLVLLVHNVLPAQRAERGTDATWSTLFLSPPRRTPDLVRTASGRPGPHYWQQQADYRIEATLDAESGTLSASLRLHYTNNSPEDLPFLWFHLEQNIFRKDSTARLMADAGGGVGERIESETTGIELSHVRARGKDLTYSVHDTLMRVELPKPLRAGGHSVDIEIAWSFRIPDKAALRMGRTDTPDGPIFALAQWFPAVAKFDDIHGWNTLPYLGSGEFYTDFGDYEVEITVPRSHVVASTGTLENPSRVLTSAQREALNKAASSQGTVSIRCANEVALSQGRPEGDGPLTWEFHAKNVRTFAFASSQAFVWDAATASTGTLCQSFYPRSALPLWEEGTRDLRESIEHYSRQWFPYPWPVANNINAFGTGGGGMEYPMIIFNGRCDSSYDLFALVAHEIGHNWFPMVVNTDERRHAWMDEGFNTFINYYPIVERFGSGGSWFDKKDWTRAWIKSTHPMSTAPDRMPAGSLGFLAYDKPAWMMRTLREEVLGTERFDRAFRDYVHAWAMKSPTPDDFMRCMENAAGSDLSWFWQSWIFGAALADVAIEEVNAGDDATEVRVRHQRRFVQPVPWLVELTDGKKLEGTIPVDSFAAGPAVSFSCPVPTKSIRRITLDAQERWPDVQRGNNVRVLAK
jgi:hypothetical protein